MKHNVLAQLITRQEVSQVVMLHLTPGAGTWSQLSLCFQKLQVFQTPPPCTLSYYHFWKHLCGPPPPLPPLSPSFPLLFSVCIIIEVCVINYSHGTWHMQASTLRLYSRGGFVENWMKNLLLSCRWRSCEWGTPRTLEIEEKPTRKLNMYLVRVYYIVLYIYKYNIAENPPLFSQKH